MAVVEIERVRFAAEHDALTAMQRHHPQQRVAYVPRGLAKRRVLLAQSLLLAESMAQDAHRSARVAAERLCVAEPIELYQSASTFDTVRIALDQPIGIEFLGGYLAQLDEGAVLAVIGHEIGHAMAHTRNPKFAWALDASQRADTPSRRTYAMAAEITADRFGLLACRDLGAVLRLEMHGPAGKSGIRFDTDAYLTQCQDRVGSIVADRSGVVGRTHPEHYVRGYAEWLFSESDVYASMTGAGPGTRRIEDVDAELCSLLGVTAAARLPKRPGEVRTPAPAASPPPPRSPVSLEGDLVARFQEHVRRQRQKS